MISSARHFQKHELEGDERNFCESNSLQNAFAVWSWVSRPSSLHYINHLHVLTVLTPWLSYWLLWNWNTATDDSFLPSVTLCPVLRIPWQAQGGQREEERRGWRDKDTKTCLWHLWFLDPTVGLGFLFCLLLFIRKGSLAKGWIQFLFCFFPSLFCFKLILRFILWNLRMPFNVKSYCRFHEDSFKEQFCPFETSQNMPFLPLLLQWPLVDYKM